MHISVPWEYERTDKFFDVRTLCDTSPWDDGHGSVKYGDKDANCKECLEIYSILKSDWNASSK